MVQIGAQEPAQQPGQEEFRAEERQETMALVVRADRLIGQTVRDSNDQRIGRVDDLALRQDDGTIAYVVVAHGGVFGIGGERVAVSWDRLQTELDQRVVRLDMTEQELEQAPRIDPRGEWPGDLDMPGQQPGTPEAGRDPAPGGQETAAAPELEHEVLRMSRLIGMDVENLQGERLGQIDDFAITHDGEVPYAVVAHGGFLGLGHTYVAVPWERFDLDRQEQRVNLNVTRQQLDAARPFEYADRWPESVEWPFVEPTQ